VTDTIEPLPAQIDQQKLAEELVAQAREEGVRLVGAGGLLTGLTKSVVEMALEEELSDHLGCWQPVSGPEPSYTSVLLRCARGRCLHNVSMPNVLIRDVPENVHARLQSRADMHGQSLQQYLASELRRLAERPSMDEVLARIATRHGGRVGLQQAVQDLTVERDRR